MYGSMLDIQSATAEIRRGIKKKKKKKEERRKKKEERNHRANIMVCPIPYGGHNKLITPLGARSAQLCGKNGGNRL